MSEHLFKSYSESRVVIDDELVVPGGQRLKEESGAASPGGSAAAAAAAAAAVAEHHLSAPVTQVLEDHTLKNAREWLELMTVYDNVEDNRLTAWIV